MNASLAQASALNRFGLGARPGDLEAAHDPRDGLLRQITPEAARLPDHGLPDSAAYLREELALLRELRRGRQTDAAPNDAAARRTATNGRGRLRQAVARGAGARRVLGRRYGEGGVRQGEAILHDLAVHPATARHVSRKLAAHFVADDPPPALVERMTQAWLRSGGALTAVYRALIDSEEAWSPHARKFRTPDDLILAALRAAGTTAPIATLHPLLTLLGQPPFTPRSPAGFPDDATPWAGADALYKRVQVAQRLSALAPEARPDPLAIARGALGARLDADTATAVRRAESTRAGLAVLFASPAFQWRS